MATEKEITDTRGLLRTGDPVVVTGDMNERDLFFCRFTGGVQMRAANGGSNNGRCRPPSPAQIDWIFGSRQARFSNYQALRNDQVAGRPTTRWWWPPWAWPARPQCRIPSHECPNRGR